MRVLSIDPGKTTGWAIGVDGVMVNHGQVDAWLPFCNWACAQVADKKVDRVLIESFIITQATLKKSRQYEPMWIAGVMQWACAAAKIECVMQPPSKREMGLKAIKRGVPGWSPTGRHAKDAAGHLIVYFYEQGQLTADDLLGEPNG